MAVVRQRALFLAQGRCSLPSSAPHSQPSAAAPRAPHLHCRGVQWEQQRLSFPGPQANGSEQLSRSQWGTPPWCRTEQILRGPRSTGGTVAFSLFREACPPWEGPSTPG